MTINTELTTESMMGGIFAFMGTMWILVLAVSVLFVVVYWKLFQKAGEPGWASLIPFYCNYVLFKIAFGNGWMFLLSLVPIVNFVVAVLLPFKLAKAYGKDIGYGFGLLFLSVIFYPILAFDSSTYIGIDK